MDDALSNKIGTQVRKAREAQGQTQQDVAEMLGVSVEFYSRIERGKALPSLETFVRIALALRISSDKLLGLADMEGVKSAIEEYLPAVPEDTPEFKRLVRRLRRASPKTRRVADVVVRELESPDPPGEDAADPNGGELAADRRDRARRGRKGRSEPPDEPANDDDDPE